MDFTSDKLRSLVRKWQTLIEAHVDVKTTDGYLIRLFSIGFTKKRPNQVKKTTYAKASQIREIRKKMFEIMIREASSCDLKQLVAKLVPEVIGRAIEKSCQGIYPLSSVYIRKVKILKAPKFDLAKLNELHGDSGVSEETGSKVVKEFKVRPFSCNQCIADPSCRSRRSLRPSRCWWSADMRVANQQCLYIVQSPCKLPSRFSIGCSPP